MKTESKSHADEAKSGSNKSHEYKVAGVTADKLMSTCSKGDDHEHIVTKATKVTCDGEACELSDLQPGTKVRVTTKSDGKTATAIESKKLASTAPLKA